MSFVSTLTVTNSWQPIFTVDSTGYIFLSITENFGGGRIGVATLNSFTDESGNPVVTMVTCRGFTLFDGQLPANFSMDGTRIYSLRSVSNILEVQVASGSYSVTFEMFSSSQFFDSGPHGAQGPPGVGGAQGVQGSAGVTGSQGSQGPQGPVGTGGVGGSQGSQGAQGVSPTGSQGEQGSQGNQGAQGNLGAQGTAGGTGTTGGAGSTGLVGAQGNNGPQGTSGTAPSNSASISLVSGSVVSTGIVYLTQAGFTTDINLSEFILPTVSGGTITGFVVSIFVPPSPGTRFFTLYLNGAAAMSPPAIIGLSNTLTSWSGSIPFTSFDRIALQCNTTLTPQDTQIRATIEFTL